MTPEERRAFIQAEEQRRTAERMAAMGLSAPPSSSSPKPSLDTSTEDRLAREKKEAEEKAFHLNNADSDRCPVRHNPQRQHRHLRFSRFGFMFCGQVSFIVSFQYLVQSLAA